MWIVCWVVLLWEYSFVSTSVIYHLGKVGTWFWTKIQVFLVVWGPVRWSINRIYLVLRKKCWSSICLGGLVLEWSHMQDSRETLKARACCGICYTWCCKPEIYINLQWTLLSLWKHCTFFSLSGFPLSFNPITTK